MLWQRARSTEKNAKATVKANKLMKAGHTRERLNTSIKHLGNNNEYVRISAIHTLYDLAEEKKNYRKKVSNILCNYIRQKTQKKTMKKTLRVDQPKK